MKPFWKAIISILIGSVVISWLTAAAVAPGISIQASHVRRYVVAYSLSATYLGVVWAVLFRSQVESRRVSLAAVFALVTIQAIGLAFAQFMLSL